MMTINRKILFYICLLILPACGEAKPVLVPANGKIIFKGKPLTAGSIYFHPAATNKYTNDNPSSILMEDGSFSMKTFPYGEGISPGKYTITLAPQLASRITRPDLSDPSRSKLSITVPEEGMKNLMINVSLSIITNE